MEFFGWFICVLICSLIGALIGKSKGRVGSGLIWSFLLGPIGWLIVALMADLRPMCSECGGVIVEGARKCKHCGSDIDRMFDVKCPACGERGQLRESRMDGEVTCPKCQRVFSASSARI